MITRRNFLKISLGISGLAIFSLSPCYGEKFIDTYQINLPTKDKPIYFNSIEKRVFLYTEINVKNLYETNPHWGVVFIDGKYSEKAILKAYANPLNFYDALIEIGAKPGNNLTKNSNGEYVKGDELIVSALLPGKRKEFSLNDIFYDSIGKGFDIRFGGNRTTAFDEKTGCITCLESCCIGITSNAVYPTISSFRRFISPNSRFRGKPEVLPAKDGAPVILIYNLRSKTVYNNLLQKIRAT